VTVVPDFEQLTVATFVEVEHDIDAGKVTSLGTVNISLSPSLIGELVCTDTRY